MDKKLKSEFIKYFGEEKWNQENTLSKLWPIQLAICKDLGIEPIPVVVEEIEEDSRYYIKEDYPIGRYYIEGRFLWNGEDILSDTNETDFFDVEE